MSNGRSQGSNSNRIVWMNGQPQVVLVLNSYHQKAKYKSLNSVAVVKKKLEYVLMLKASAAVAISSVYTPVALVVVIY